MTYYFTANWCGPCQALKPMAVASGKIDQFVDVDVNRELANAYNIKSVPTVIVVDGNSVLLRLSGAGAIQTWLNSGTK